MSTSTGVTRTAVCLVATLTTLPVWGRSGRTPEYGLETMIESMKMMTGWHRDAFSVFLVGKGWDVYVTEIQNQKILEEQQKNDSD